MTSRRALKLAEAVRQVVSATILFEVKDPRVSQVTVTFVEVADDLRTAKVHVSVMGDENRQRLALFGLQSAAGFLQARCAKKIETRFTPRLRFVLDQGVKRSIEITQILSEVLPSDSTASDGEATDEREGDDREGMGTQSSAAETPGNQRPPASSPPTQ